jgi:DNA-binding beta-propeller fold protein YncE
MQRPAPRCARLVVTAVAFGLAVSACSGGAAEAEVAAPPAAPLITLPPVATTSTTSTTTTTTTTTLPPQRLELVVEPEPAAVRLQAADGTVLTVETPYSGELSGPVTVSLDAAGRNPMETTIDLATDRSVTLWLDPEGQLLHKIAEFGTGGAPKQVAFTPDGSELWVTLLAGTGLEVYDPQTGERLAAVELPEAGSVEVIFNAAGTLAYVSQMETASVYEMEVATRRVLRRLDTTGVWTKVVALSPDEQTLFASNWVSNDVSEIDLRTGEVRRKLRTVTTPRGLYVTEDRDRLYVAGYENGDIQVFDLATGEGEVIFSTGGAMRHLVGDPATGLLYASDMARAMVYVVDTATDEVRELAATDRVPNTIDLSPDGRVVYVSNRGRNNPETYYKPGPEWGTVVVIDTATGGYLDAVVGGNQTTGLDVSADGTMLAFSDFLDDRVSVYTIPPYEVLATGGGGRYEAHLAEIQK